MTSSNDIDAESPDSLSNSDSLTTLDSLTTSDSLISFGSNLGRRHEYLTAALESLWEIDGLQNLVASDPVVTKAVGGPEDQPNFLNAVFRVTTTLSPQSLHQHLLEIEEQLGRERRTRWGSRKIDLDLLLHGQMELDEPDLIVPHPRMSFRRFVLEPAIEIAADMVHPSSGCTLAELVEKINNGHVDFTIAGTKHSKPAWLSLAEGLGINGFDEVEFSKSHFADISGRDDVTKLEPQTKLLVFDINEFGKDLHNALIRFRGPTLNLSGRSASEKSREIQAAMATVK